MKLVEFQRNKIGTVFRYINTCLIQVNESYMSSNTPQAVPGGREDQATFESQPDLTPRREGGDDALAETSEALEASAPTDSRLDEKVIDQHSDQSSPKPS